MNETVLQIKSTAMNIFAEKHADYGPSWLLFRFPSLVDQMWIKILRIRALEEQGGKSAIGEGVESEYLGLINYAVIALIQRNAGEKLPAQEAVLADLTLLERVDESLLLSLYEEHFQAAYALLLLKNSDYSDAWRKIERSSITDLILVKLVRMKHILRQQELLVASEGIDSQLHDIINYALFALIRLHEAGEAHV